MTNEEKIKAMSREGLARLIYAVYSSGLARKSPPYCRKPRPVVYTTKQNDEFVSVVKCPTPCDKYPCDDAPCLRVPICNEALKYGFEACQKCITEWLGEEAKR